ncbi:MAG: hypothetical protein V4608_16575 [Bacteroidota bacterium]
MTDNIYIKFRDTPSTLEEKKKSLRVSKILYTILFFIPKANPEYKKFLDDVSEWLLEIDPVDNLPIREIAKDTSGKILFIMPWRNDYGYWTDNNIKTDYFMEYFKASIIDKAEFNNNWDEFAKLNPETNE